MHITGMTIGWAPPFREPIRLEFNEQVNLFIGPNAVGKSTLLRQLNRLGPGVTVSEGWSDIPWREKYEENGYDPSELAHLEGFETQPFPYVVPMVFIPATRVGHQEHLPERTAKMFLKQTEGTDHQNTDEWGLMDEIDETMYNYGSSLNQPLLILGREGYSFPVFYAERVKHATNELRDAVAAIGKDAPDNGDAFDRDLFRGRLGAEFAGVDRDPFRRAMVRIMERVIECIRTSPFLQSLDRITVMELAEITRISVDDIYCAVSEFHQGYRAAGIRPHERPIRIGLPWDSEELYRVGRIECDITYIAESDNDHIGSLGRSRVLTVVADIHAIASEDVFMHCMDGYTSRAAANWQKAILLAHRCAVAICNEIVRDEPPRHHTTVVHGRDSSGLPVDYTITEFYSDVGPTHQIFDAQRYDLLDKPRITHRRTPLHMWELSAGTEGTLSWVRYLALNMVHYYKYKFGWEKQPAILLIDEIENHLHPTWQRRIIPALLEHFPGLQIFATTHSPFVVAGLKAGQVHLLNRDADGNITASTNTEDIVGWTADEILRTLMGVDDPTDDATAAAARELRQLRDEGPRADAQEEERRQVRMQELRQRVDRDLLAGGPMVAQRELFEQQFNEALEKYRQSRNLNQDNG